MFRRWQLVAVLVLVLLLSGTFRVPASAQDTGTGWQATYWNNVNLAGNAVLARNETAVNHDWGFSSPAPAVSSDRFSARWQRTLQLPQGQYRFTVTVDDGARLWVDGRLIIDEWQVQAATTYSSELFLSGGDIPVRLEYFENTGLARVQLSWMPITDFSNQWTGEYYNNQSLSGDPALVRADATVNFDWGTGSPAPDLIAPNTFSARWTRTLDLTPGQYRFTVTVDDGARLWVDNQLLIDAWELQAATTYTEEILLPGGETPVELAYFENGGLAEVVLSWTQVDGDTAPPPDLGVDITVVDNGSAGFVRGGDPASDWNLENEGFDGSLLWTENSDRLPTSYNWARWSPALTPGVYDVSVYIPDRFSTTSQARYWISHADDLTLRIVDQSANSGRWVSLGTYEFEGTSNDYVSLADVTFEPEASRLVAYDAVRWTPVDQATGGASMTVTPTVVSPGEQVVVNGRGFPPGQTASLGMGPPNTEPFGRYGEAVVLSDGSVMLSFTMPGVWPDGTPILETLPEGSNELVLILITDDGIRATASLTFQR